MKIYIVGSIASGKSTLAKHIAEILKTSYYSLDELVHEPDKNSPFGNKKIPVEIRDSKFLSILKQQSWIIEDVGRPCFEEGLIQADKILLIELPARIRNWRILLRWIKQNLKIEPCIYTPSVHMLKCMLQWSKDYDSGKDKLKERLSTYKGKVVILKNNKEVRKYLCEMSSSIKDSISLEKV